MIVDITSDNPDLAAALRSELERWGKGLDGGGSGVEARSKTQEAALRSLGYLE
jgi:hypothetical protein